jgi:type VI secretion system protein ImpI
VINMPLSLILEVSGERAQELGEMRRKVFGDAGGRIGRAPDCDWVLSNRYISRHHATVSCIDGVFHIESVGENGVAVNDQEAMLPQLVRRALASGDRLFIDEYEINVAIADDQSMADDQKVVSRGESLTPTQSATLPPGAAEALLPADADLEPLKRFLSRPASTPTIPGAEPAWNHSSSLADHFNPPPVPKAVAAIPKGWEEELARVRAQSAVETGVHQSPFMSAASPATAIAASQGQPATAGGFDGLAFLAGAGLEPENVPAEMASILGQIVRSVVQGLMDVLRARAEFRNQFRLPVTRVQMAQNNPLKFAINAEDALTALLRTRARGYLPPREAFDDAFDDVRFHQLAMLAGMRAGFESMMNRFDPKKLQKQADRRSHGFWARFGAKQRYWDRYVDQYEQMAGNADSVFQRLYGEEFSGAYERQLEELKRTRVKSSP